MSKQQFSFVLTLLLFLGILNAGNELRVIQLLKDGVNSVDKLKNPTGMAITPNGKYLYAAAYGDDAVAIFSRNSRTGKLSYTGNISINNPRLIRISPDSKHLYVKNLNTNIYIYSINDESGALTSVDSLSSLARCKDFQLSSDGKHLYLAYKYGVKAYTRDSSTGKLSLLNTYSGIDGDPVNLSISYNDKFVLRSSTRGVVSFNRNTTTGALTELRNSTLEQDTDVLSDIYTTATDTSGKFIYISSAINANLITRKISDGTISYTERKSELDDFLFMHVYNDRLITISNSKLDVFSINSNYGGLNLLDSYGTDSFQGARVLDSPKEVVVSPDGKNIYVVSYKGGKITVLDRGPTAPSSTAYTASKTSITLSWGKNSETDVAGYNVYRSTTSGFTSSSESITKLARVTNSGSPSHIDTQVEKGKTYYYGIKVIDKDSILSDYSSEIAANLSSDVKLTLDMSELIQKGWDSSADEIGARFAFSDITNNTIVNGALEKKRGTFAAESTGSTSYSATIELNATIGTKISWKLRAGPALLFSNKGWENGDLRKFTFTGNDTTINVGKPNITPPGVIAGLDPDKLYKGSSAFVTISGGNTYYETSGLKNVYLTLLTQGSSTINVLSDSTISAVSYQVDSDSTVKAMFEVKDYQTIPVGDWQLGIEYKNDEGRVRKKGAISILEKDISILEDIISLNNLSLKTDSLGSQTWDESDRLSVLDLSNLEAKITMLPGTISELENLKRLYIDNNDLTSIPPSIGELKRLETLSIANNSIKSLPESIGNLSFLDTLNISGNGIEELPLSVTSLGNLKELQANNNKLKFLPDEINNLKRLKVLNLHDNNLTSLPQNIVSLDSLETLSLTGNSFDEIPEEVFALSSLTLFTAGYNGLVSIPDSLQKLEKLQTFRIYGNDLRDIPDFLFKMPNLKEIDLAENFLFCENGDISKDLIPDELISNTYEVTGLDDQNCMEFNVLQALVDSNGIDILPSQLGQLEWFKKNENERHLVGATFNDPSYKLSKNRLLGELPLNIGDLPDIETLNLKSNRLTQLPVEIGNLNKLYSLDVSDNYLTELPDTISSMETLISLNIKDNFLYCDKGVQDSSSIPLYLTAGHIDYLTGLYDQRCVFQPYKNLLFSSKSIEFLEATIHTITPDSFKIKNSGTLPVDNISYEFNSDNFFLMDSISSLSVNDSSFIKIGFSPRSIKSFDDTLWIHSDAFDSALVINLYGNAVHSLGIDSDGNLPTDFMLHQNYPNPFNPTTLIKYDLPESRITLIQVYDILGKQIRTIVNGHEESGFKAKVWDGRDDVGRQVSAGVYLYRIQAGQFTQTRKMLLLK